MFKFKLIDSKRFKFKLIDSKKFHSMKATVETVRFDDGMTVKRLVSYDSVVCDVDLETGTIFFYPRFQFSPTTVRQLTRFLNEYVPIDNERWGIGMIRQLQEVADSNGHAVIGKYAVSFLILVLGTNWAW